MRWISVKLLRYKDFLDRVEELGFMPFSGIVDGLPSLVGETPVQIWHTGDPETDPWRWKDIAAEEKRLAFGCVLGGNKGFIAPRLYPVFLAACRPSEHMEERRYSGMVSQTVWELWKLFEDRKVLDTSEIRSCMGVKGKKGGGKVDSAIVELQRLFQITVAGSRQKIDKKGQPYGWHINVYERVEDWVPSEWATAGACGKNGISCGADGSLIPMDRYTAIETILDIGVKNGHNVDRDKLAKALKLDMYE
jgi:hypothetical protein